MLDGTDDEIIAPPVELGQADPIFMFDLRLVGEGIGDIDRMAEPPKPLDDVDRPAVSKVRHIFLEGQAEHQHRPGLGPAPLVEGVGDPAAHPVVDAAACKDHLGVVPELLRQVAQIIRIHPDAVAADQPRLEGKEVPFRPGCGEHVPDR